MSEKHEKAEKRPAGLARWDPFGEIDLFDRWTPLRELMAPSSRLARLFEGVLGEAGRGTRGFAPAVDIDENDAQYTVTVEIPGGKKEDVQVEIEEGVLTIRGEKKSEREEKKDQRRWVERSYGSFVRSFTLPKNADAEHVDASFKDGILTLVIPKTEVAKPRSIAVK